MSAAAGETLQRVIDFKVLRVGTSADQPPLTMLNKQGAPMGFDIDLARALAKAMRAQLEIQLMPFGELLTALQKDEIDMVISNMSITPERAEQAYLTAPYMMSGKSILTRDKALADAASSEALNRDGLKLAAVEDSTSAMYVREHAPQAKLVSVASSDEGVAKLLTGEVDALLADMAVCKLAALRHGRGGLVTMETPLTVEPVGIAVAGDDPQFQNLVENYLAALGKVGALTSLRKKWFEDGEWVSALP